jgi:nitrite reductase (NADH) small subunit/3-phenylpropionate/trans-cinnamate dioxygenase ferredoxin subunit
MAEFFSVARVSEVPAGSGRVVEAGGREIAVFNVGGTFYAIDNICKHRGGPLGEGMLDQKVVTCPWHAWTYDVTNGQCTFRPEISIDTFEVKVEGNEVRVAV